MAVHSPRLWLLAVALLLWSPHVHTREFTHEDIREALLSLVHMIRSSEDKLERHEFREKALGEQLKRMLTGLDRKHRALEPLNGMISRLDERLSNVETILLQKEEREKSSQNKVHEALESIQKSLQSLTAPAKPQTDLESKLSASNTAVLKRLDATDAKIEAVKKEIDGLKSSLSQDTLRSICIDAASNFNPFERHISEAEKLLNKYELKLNEYNVTASKVPTDFVPLSEVSLADEAWHGKMTEVMERQEVEVKKIQRLLSDAEGMWKDLPRLADLNRSTNQSLEAIEKAKEAIVAKNDQIVDKVGTKLREMGDRLVVTNEDIQKSLTQSNTMTERAYDDISRSYQSLRAEVQALSISEQVLTQTADNVIATKKRIEYGVHQILMEIGELIKLQHRDISKVFNTRLDTIESKITSNQTVAFRVLTSKFENEIAPVWRQIGVMYQQIMMSKESLDKLTENNLQYANNNTASMDKVKKELENINTRVAELQENLNYVLGRVSLATQEFGQMSAGLVEILKSTKSSTTQAPVVGPGPHNIPAEKTT